MIGAGIFGGKGPSRQMVAKALRRPSMGEMGKPSMGPQADGPRPVSNGKSWGWMGSRGGGGGGAMAQMGFGDAFGSFMNEMSGQPGVKGAIYGPAAAERIPGYKAGQVRAVAPKNWNSPFTINKGKGKRA
jgi:hypothetical protein